MGFAIVILPLFIETVVDMMRGMVWKTEDNKVELSFEECQIKFVLNNQLYVLLFGTYIGNQIVFFNKKNEIIGEGIINYKKKIIVVSQINYSIEYLKNSDNVIKFQK